MAEFFFNEKKFELLEGVYTPAEDSFLLAEAVKVKEGWNCLDMGTGSGIQTVNMLLQGASVVATDMNEKALENVKLNAEKIGLGKQLEARKSDLFEKVPEKFDCIAFNPPYVHGSRKDWKDTDGGIKGREILDRFIDGLEEHLKENGIAFFLQSSLNGEEKTKEKLQEKELGFEAAAKKKLFFEELVVFKCWKK